jgi:hypothetical protein
MSRQSIASLSFFSHKREGDSDVVHIMDALEALFELICRQLCAKDLCCLSQTCRKLHSVVAAEHQARCEDFARGQEAVPVKVLWYVPFLYFCFSAMGAQIKKQMMSTIGAHAGDLAIQQTSATKQMSGPSIQMWFLRI